MIQGGELVLREDRFMSKSASLTSRRMSTGLLCADDVRFRGPSRGAK